MSATVPISYDEQERRIAGALAEEVERRRTQFNLVRKGPRDRQYLAALEAYRAALDHLGDFTLRGKLPSGYISEGGGER